MKTTIDKLAASAFALAVAFSIGTASAADKTKVGFVYVGPIGDHGWSYEHNQGRLAVDYIEGTGRAAEVLGVRLSVPPFGAAGLEPDHEGIG